MAEYALGIDVGTSGVKVAVLDLSSFSLIALAMRGYDNSPQQSSRMLWDATAATIRDAVATVDVRAIRGISFSAQMHGTVLYDDHGQVIEPIINWQDKRCDVPLDRYGGRSTVEVMMERLDGPEFDDLGIDVVSSGHLGATLFYIKENDPALFGRIHQVALPGDFIRAQILGGYDRATDPTNAFGTDIFNTRLTRWHDTVLAQLGLPGDLLPAVHDTAGVAGTVPTDLAHALGLAPGTPVVYGGGDNQMSLLGNGLIDGDSPPLINIGTGAQVSQVASQYVRIPGLETRSHFGGSFILVGASKGGGRNYARLRDELRRRLGAGFDYPQMDELAAYVAVGADGLAYQVSSRGAVQRREGFLGRTDLTDAGHQTRAVMEGILLDLYARRPPPDAGGTRFMIGSGKGLQNSPVWAQMAADIFNCPLKVTNFENAVWGAALNAAVGVGAVAQVGDALATIAYHREYLPDPAQAAQYRALVAQRVSLHS